VNPDLALISAGKDNRFGHPHSDVMDRYQLFGITQKTTTSGVISLVFD
jgi:competence protein ComEC